MKKLLLAVFLVISMASVAHATPDADYAACVEGCNANGDTGGACVDACVANYQTATGASGNQNSNANTGGNGAFVPLAPIPGLTDQSALSAARSTNLASFFNNLYKYSIGLAAMLAIIMIIWGGLEYATQDSISKKSDGRERIYNAIFGLILVLLPVLVFSIINPAILNLSISLPELDTRSSAPASTQTTQPVTLSNTQTQDRQSSGGAVLYAVTLDPNQRNATPVQVRNILNGKQSECTAASGGPGIILPDTRASEGGGNLNYVCQTCPPNTRISLFAPGCSTQTRTCGSCVTP